MKIICLYPSIHFVLKAEKALKAKGFRPNLIPVPKEISGDCGMALEIGEEELTQLKILGLSPEAIYRRTDHGFERLLDS